MVFCYWGLNITYLRLPPLVIALGNGLDLPPLVIASGNKNLQPLFSNHALFSGVIPGSHANGSVAFALIIIKSPRITIRPKESRAIS